MGTPKAGVLRSCGIYIAYMFDEVFGGSKGVCFCGVRHPECVYMHWGGDIYNVFTS